MQSGHSMFVRRKPRFAFLARERRARFDLSRALRRIAGKKSAAQETACAIAIVCTKGRRAKTSSFWHGWATVMFSHCIMLGTTWIRLQNFAG
jgi:hypothetical protein